MMLLVFAAAPLVIAADCSPNASQAAEGSLADIIAKNTEALGGAAALDAIQTMVKHTLIEEGDSRYAAIFATDRKGRMRIDIFADGSRVYAESYDGRKGHQWSPKAGQSAASERGTTALSRTPQFPNHIFRLKDMAANGHRLSVPEKETIEDTEYYVLKLTLSDGAITYLFVDTSSWHVTRTRSRRALHVDVNAKEKTIETRNTDFRRVGDILHPHRAEEVNLATNEVMVRTTLEKLELNIELPSGYFSDLVNLPPATKSP